MVWKVALPKPSQIKSDALSATFVEKCQCISCERHYSDTGICITKASNN